MKMNRSLGQSRKVFYTFIEFTLNSLCAVFLKKAAHLCFYKPYSILLDFLSERYRTTPRDGN